jgi:hypothetical protein
MKELKKILLNKEAMFRDDIFDNCSHPHGRRGKPTPDNKVPQPRRDTKLFSPLKPKKTYHFQGLFLARPSFTKQQ